MSEQNVKETQVSEAVVAETAETSNQREGAPNNRGERRGRGERRNNRAREEEKDKYIERVGDHQPRFQGRQGWSSLQLHRTGRR